jgi:hypothetical protein
MAFIVLSHATTLTPFLEGVGDALGDDGVAFQHAHSRAVDDHFDLGRIASLWDYIDRAMPWNAPKSLKE